MNIPISSSEDEPDPHLITSKLEVLSILRSIEKDQTLIRVHARRPNSTFITTLLEVRAKEQTLIFDNAPQSDTNQRLINADHAICEALLDSVHIRFSVTGIQRCLQHNKPALSAGIPPHLSRIQRRDSYRISTPVANPVYCSVIHNDEEVQLVLDDISASGLGAFDDGQALEITPGRLYKDCVIDLPTVGKISLDLRVAYAHPFTTPNGTTRQRIGFSFDNASGVLTNTVQRYVSFLERELIAKKKGLA
ncbi:MAG: flagellar brake protein [Pusillimonas sp.]|nr:MAG: flagellar brake protein [Pusillimonas sp.]